jgi:hypothetical protein
MRTAICAVYDEVEKTIFNTENRTESRSSFTNTFQNIVEEPNPYQSKNRRRRRRRFCVRRTMYHIYPGQRRPYAGNCACVYGICSGKNKIENETNLTDYFQPNLT